MTGLLFGSFALQQMLFGTDAVLLRWMEQDNRGDVYTTCNAIARLSSAACGLSDAMQRRLWQKKLETVPRKLAKCVLSLDFQSAVIYGDLRQAVGDEPFDELDLLDLAIASENHLAFVAPAQAWHRKVASQIIMDPWTPPFPVSPVSPTVTSSP